MKKFSIKSISLLVCVLVAISGSAMLLASCADKKEETTTEEETTTATSSEETDTGMPETITADSLASADLAAIAQSYADQGYAIYSISAMGVDPEATYVDGFVAMPESEDTFAMASALVFNNAEDAQVALDDALLTDGTFEYTTEEVDGHTVYTAATEMSSQTITYYPDTFIIESLVTVSTSSATPTTSDTLVTEG